MKIGSVCPLLLLTVSAAVIVPVALLVPGELIAGVLPNNEWELLIISYPPDRDVSVTLGGGPRTLTSRGLSKIKYENEAATMEIEVVNLPSSQTIGWPGTQYVLWAIDEERRAMNLGPIPGSGDGAKWNVRVPFRVFGLLVTAEKNAQAETPSTAVVLESLLPTDRYLVIPVFRVNVDLTPPQG